MHLFLKIFITVLLITCPALGHDLLTPLQQYAAAHPETQEAATHAPLFARLRSWFASTPQLSFTFDLYKNILMQLNEQREQFKKTDVQFLRIPDNSKVIVWADLSGDLHALIKDLTYLNQQGLMGTHLDIADKTYFVFNGNSLEHAPYPLETLTVICMLMRQNPESVLYVRGPNESAPYWRDKKLVGTMQRQYPKINGKSFGQQLTEFFDTLPDALFIALESKPLELVRISHSTDTYKLVDEQHLGNLFEQSEKKITSSRAGSAKTTVNDIDVKVLIQTEHNRITTRPLQSLRLDNQVYGATSWKMFGTFITLDFKQQINDSTLTLGDQEHETYRTVTGAPQGSPAFAQPITDELWISSTTPLLAERTARDKNTQDALALAINEKNKTGGINGTLLRALTTRSDYSSYEKQRELLEFFKRNSLDSILLPITPISLEHVSSATDLPLYFYFPTSNSTAHHTTQNSIALKATTADETRILVNALLDNYNLRSFAFFYQNDMWGQEALQEAQKILKERGISSSIVAIPYHESDITFHPQAQAIIDANPDAIGFFSTPQATKALINEIGLYSLATKKLFALSQLSEAPFKYFLKKIGLTMTFAAHVPNPRTSMTEIAQEYRKTADNDHALYTVASFEAYVASTLFVHALEHVKAPYDNKKIMEYLEGLHDFNFKGMSFTFNPAKRSLAQHLWIETGEAAEWKKYAI